MIDLYKDIKLQTIQKTYNNMKTSQKYHNSISVFLNRHASKKYKLGFTLIELMVVISIIGLLSSIVLASLKDARDKANVVKFSSEINQFKTALELYRADKGEYPYENKSSLTTFNSDDNRTTLNDGSSNPTQTSVATMMSNYIKILPNFSNECPYVLREGSCPWFYRTNKNTLSDGNYRCVGDVSVPKYVIIFLSPTTDTKIFNHYSYLPQYEQYINNGWVTSDGTRCFSLK